MSVYWLVWLVVGFGVPEAVALVRRRTDWTLSGQVWELEGTGASITRFVVAAVLVWLFGHMVFGLWRTLR
jgi:hypothetical protein